MNTTTTEMTTQVVTRPVTVNRDREPRAAFAAVSLGRKTCVAAEKAIDTIPKGGSGVKSEVVSFFLLGRYVADDELEREFKARRIKPDPFAVMAVNEADRDFGNRHPNTTLWQKSDGFRSHLSFDQNGGKPCVSIDSIVSAPFGPDWWFGGTADTDQIENSEPLD